MKETTKDILHMAWMFLGVLLIGIPAMLTWMGVYIKGISWIFSYGIIEIIGISAFPILISIKSLMDKYGKK